MAENKWVGGTNAKWSTATNWSKGEVPKAEDDVVLEGSKNLEPGATGLKCRSLRATGYTGKVIWNASTGISIGDATAGTGNVALDLTGVTLEATNTTWNMNFVTTSATAQSLNFGGQLVANVKVEANGGNYELASDLKMATVANVLTHTRGTLVSSGHTVDIGLFSGTGTLTRTLNIENSLIKLKTEIENPWDWTNVTGLSVAAGGSTIELLNPSASGPGSALPKFIGGGKIFATLKVGGAAGNSAPALEITGSNTFTILANNTSSAAKTFTGSITGTTLTVVSGSPALRIGSLIKGAGVTAGTTMVKELTATTFEVSVSQTVAEEAMESFAPGLILAGGTTQTVEGYESNGKSGAPAKLSSSKSGEAATLKKSNEVQVSVDWQLIKDSKVDATPKWYAGVNSVTGGGNTNWNFEAPPGTAVAVAMLL